MFIVSHIEQFVKDKPVFQKDGSRRYVQTGPFETRSQAQAHADFLSETTCSGHLGSNAPVVVPLSMLKPNNQYPMLKAIAFRYQPARDLYVITCEEGTLWSMESKFLDKDRPVYSPYTGNRVEMVATMGAMKSHLPFHPD